jgi:hypothetical protein
MTYRLALNSAWAKFERGRQHVRAFRAAVESKLGAHPIYYQLRREYDAELPAITWKIEGRSPLRTPIDANALPGGNTNR